MCRTPAGLHFLTFAVVLAAIGLAGCNPSLNWREVRVKDSSLVALLPCKAEASSRQVNLGGQTVDIHLSSCNAGDATFGVAVTRLSTDSASEQLDAAQQHWRLATLANIGLAPSENQNASIIRETPIQVKGLAANQILVAASGKRPGGDVVQMNGIWFRQGAQLFHAVIYADKINNDMAEPFFSGLKIQ